VVILADTSAWLDYLRDVPGGLAERVEQQLGTGLLVTDVVLMEVLAGARDRQERDRLRRLLGLCDYAPVEGPADYEDAADIYRACRAGGETVRSLVDCLVAAVAIRSGAAVLHRDRDFDRIARHAPLALA
jgi:predicted nucleic acid-binding protein